MKTIFQAIGISPFTSSNNFACKIVRFEEIQIDEKTGSETLVNNCSTTHSNK